MTKQALIDQSIITCPLCGAAKTERMRTDACRIVYECTGCSMRLRRSPVIAASSARTARCRARRSRRNAVGKPASRVAVVGSEVIAASSCEAGEVFGGEARRGWPRV
jgi:hypothetical protein